MDPNFNYETPLSVSDIQNLARDDNALCREYERLYHTTFCLEKRIYDRPETDPYDRYSDIKTYDETRVKFTHKPDTDYINACFVDSPLGPDQKLIAAQGPLPDTVKHFWRMIAQEQVTLILTTCNLAEKGRTKCEKFWPDEG